MRLKRRGGGGWCEGYRRGTRGAGQGPPYFETVENEEAFESLMALGGTQAGPPLPLDDSQIKSRDGGVSCLFLV